MNRWQVQEQGNLIPFYYFGDELYINLENAVLVLLDLCVLESNLGECSRRQPAVLVYEPMTKRLSYTNFFS